MNHMEKINVRKRRTFNIVQSSKSSKTKTLSKFMYNLHIVECHKAIVKSIDFLFLSVTVKKFMITESSIMEIQNLGVNFAPKKFFLKTLALYNCRGHPAFKCQRYRVHWLSSKNYSITINMHFFNQSAQFIKSVVRYT